MLPIPSSPDETYSKVSMPWERCRRNVQIRDLGGDGRYRCTEDVRQFHAFHIDIVLHIRRSIMQRQEPINATHGVQERQQHWLGPDNDLPGDVLDKWGIADELDGIAQTVVTAHQNSLTSQRGAIPDVLQM